METLFIWLLCGFAFIGLLAVASFIGNCLHLFNAIPDEGSEGEYL